MAKQTNRFVDKISSYYTKSISTKFKIYFITISIILASLIILASKTLLSDKIKQHFINQHTLYNDVIKIRIKNYLKIAEVLSTNITAVSLKIGNNSEEIKRIIPSLLNYDAAGNIIAGGGYWPEPYKFNKQNARNSFFWGKEPNGNLRFYNDYNDPKGNGYHNEEWYVPARFKKTSGCYWSRSYVDPYSLQQMVTCTIPAIKDNKFVGVSTVDIKLDGLTSILESVAKKSGGYAFLVDRNNKFITFPDDKLALKLDSGLTDVEKHDYKYVKDLAASSDSMLTISSKLQQINDKNINYVKENYPKKLQEKTSKIVSYQIDENEAENIASGLILSQFPRPVSNIISPEDQVFIIHNDLILKQSAYVSIIEMPETMWKLVVVTPKSLIINQVNDLAYKLAIIAFILSFVVFSVFYFKVLHLIVMPIRNFIDKLKNQNNEKLDYLNDERQDEIGQIAYWYNKRTQELIDAKQEADESNNIKRDFLANTSHELRTPLNSIIGMADLLLHTKNKEDYDSSLNMILESSKNLLEIVNDILDISKIESGKIELEKIPFNLADVIKKAIAQMLPIASKRNLTINQSINIDPTVNVKGDPLRLARIITNLVSNGIKYTERGSVKFTVSTNIQNNNIHILIKVEDTGIGMKPEQKERIFNKFVQADNSITRKYGGTGLGLVITKELVELMNGTIDCESTYGVGSKFTVNVTLPVTTERVQENSKKLCIDGSCGILLPEKVNIIIAEDHQLNQIYVKKLLETLGFKNFDIVENGKEVLKKMKDKKYDILIIDGHMPELSGYDTIKIIREIESRSPNIQHPLVIIAMTANAMIGEREKFLELGADAYISKPVDRVEFQNLLATWVNFKREDNQNKSNLLIDDNIDLPVLDSSVLENFFGESESKLNDLKDLASVFKEQTDIHINKLIELQIDGECKEWTEVSHLIKGGAATIGAKKLASIAADGQKMLNSTKDKRIKFVDNAKVVYNLTIDQLKKLNWL